MKTDLDPQIISSIFELSSELVWVQQGDDRLCYASAEQKAKFDIPEVIDADFWVSRIHPDDRGRVVLDFNQAVRNKKAIFFEHEYRFKNPIGLYYHILDKQKFIRDKAGKAEQVISVWRDITDVVHKQTKLENTHTAMEIDRSRFKLISEMSNAAMWELDFLTGKMNWFAGSTALEDFGLNKDNYTVDDWKASIHPEDMERVLRYFDYITASRSRRFVDVYRVRKTGGSFAWMMDQATIIRDERGKAIRALGGWLDITRERTREQVLEKALQYQRNLNEQLMLSEANLNTTINNTTLLVWSINRDYTLMAFNEPVKNYFKATYGFELKQGEKILKDDESNPEILRLQKKWIKRYERALNGEIFKESQQVGERYMDYSLSPIVGRNGITGVSIFGEDVTERIQKERELASANKTIGELKLMALRSVMNPHFIFNALNSIQFFIAKNDRLNAINYLSTFSKLIRGILTNSVNNKVKLTDEIELLKHYVNLELLRFEEKFEFILSVSPTLEVDNIEVPSLLIQPYVENAILHGLYNKSSKGILKISVCEDQDSVLFEIEDNGIGREAARKLRQQNFPQHKSMGTILTEERFKLINMEEKASFEIRDLFEDEKSAGTLVKIWVAM
ncbi:MAG TPA: PAS domain-containing protein [Chryseolinea sp.]|nr:PAS domain-containing protein [Chryseolinea sp.]